MISAILVLLAVAGGADAVATEVVAPDGSPIPGAKVVCSETCWAAAPDGAPRRVAPPAKGALVLEPAPPAHLLVLDETSGRPVTEGLLRWLDPAIPAALASCAWTAEGGKLDLSAPGGMAVELSAPDHRPVTVPLLPGPGRVTVLLTPTGGLELEVKPSADGTVFLAPLDRVGPFSPLQDVGSSHQLKTGHAAVNDLPARGVWVGAVLPHGFAPSRLQVESLPARLEIALEPGLGLSGTVRDEQRHPLPGARIVAHGHIEELDRLPYTQDATSDEEGRFVLSGLLPGEVVLEACAPRRVCEQRALQVTSEGASTPVNLVLRPGFDLVLELVDQAGLALPGVSVMVRKVRRESDRNGRLTLPGVAEGETLAASARGGGVVPWQGAVVAKGSPQRLVLERGGSLRWPLIVPESVGQEVTVRWRRSRAGDGQPLDQGEGRWDGAHGEAVADGLRPGVVRVEADLAGFATLTSEPVTLGEAEQVVLPAAAPELGGTLAGRVVSADSGEPVPGARVACEPGGPTTFRSPGEGSRTRRAIADENGGFLVAGLGGGPYRLRVEAPGFAPTVRDGVAPDDDLGDLELGVGLTVAGHVVDRQDHPVAGVRVEAWEPVAYAYAPDVSALSDSDGAFRIERLPVGGWRLEADARGRTARRQVTGEEGETLEVELRLGGTRLAGTVLVGERAGGPGTLVLEPPGGAPAGPVVMLGRDGSRRFFGLPGQPLQAAVDGDGGFELASVDPGPWTARFAPASGGSAGAVDLVVPDVESHTCVLRFPAATVSGLVVDADDQPVGGARVDLEEGRGSRVAFADPSGAFAFAGAAPGPASLTASAQGYRPSEATPVEVPQRGDPETVTLVLKPEAGGRIDATVRTLAGSLQGAPAVLIGPSGGARFLGSDGQASWDNLDSGSYRVCSRAYGGPVGCAPPTAVDDDTVTVVLDLGRGGMVAATLGEDAVGQARARLLLPDGTDLSGLAFLGNPPQVAGGSLLLGPLAAGTYSVSVGLAGFEVSGLVDVGDGEIVELRP